MSKTMYDAAVLPTPTPSGFDVAAGYVYQAHHEAAHIWTPQEWQRAATQSRYLLPIATCWTPLLQPAADAAAAVHAWEALWPRQSCAFALDMEISVAQSPDAPGYADTWRQTIRNLGYHDIVYSSFSVRGRLGTGPLWLGPPGFPGQQTANGVVEIAQEQYLGYLDTNHAVDSVPFYDTQPHPDPPPVKKGKRMFLLFQLNNEPTHDRQTAVYVGNETSYEWTTADQLQMLIFVGTQQGLDVTIHKLDRSQLGRMQPVGPMPT